MSDYHYIDQRDLYLKQMREIFEEYCKCCRPELSLDKENGSYKDYLTDLAFMFFSTGYQHKDCK